RGYAAWGIAQLAGRSAGGLSDQLFFSELVKLVSDHDTAVRGHGISGLTLFSQRLGPKDGGRTAAINAPPPPFGDSAPAVRVAAAESLGLLGQLEKAISVLIAALNDPQDLIRLQAVAALEAWGPAARPAAEALRKTANDSSPQVKQITARVLARLDA